MTVVLYFFATGLMIAIVLFAWRLMSGYLRFRGARLVTCPETKKAAAVEVDARLAALTGGIGVPAIHLKSCSRWPESQDCGQDCLAQVEANPEGCLARAILSRWYEGRSCVCCNKAFQQMDWLEHRPALISREGVTFEWREIRPEALPEILASHLPVCWNCHVAATFRRRYPNWVVDRPWEPGAGLRSR